MEALVAVLPILLVLFLMAGFRMAAMKAMPIGWLVTVLIAMFYWKMQPVWIAAATIKGTLVALDILLVVFGAVYIYYDTRMSGAIKAITDGMMNLSKDRRIQAAIAFLLVTFFEGAAGFGTPGAIVGPLLVGIGFPPAIAAPLVLIFDSSPVSFGAVGIPVWGGLGASLDSPVVKDVLSQYGISLQDFLFKDITFWTATLHGIMAIFLPLLGATFMVLWSGGKIRDVKDALPSLLLAGICFAIPYWLLARFFGPEFPSLVGGIIGLALYAMLLKAGLGPKKVWDFRESHVTVEDVKYEREFKIFEAMIPYVLVSAGLLLTRLVPPVKTFSTGMLVMAISNILGTSLSHTFKLLYNPGTIFIIAVLLTNAIFRLSPRHTTNALKTTVKAVIPAAIALIFAVSLSQIMMNSGHNEAGLGSMLKVMAESLAMATGKFYIFLAVFVGILGAYMAGSNTVSNILFGGFQFEAANAIGLPKTIIVSLQNVGGAVGNMICVHNVVAVCTTCGILGSEGDVIRRNLVPTAIYAIVVSIVAAIVVFALGVKMV